MTDRIGSWITARSRYGSVPIRPWKARRMAAHHRKVGSAEYRLLRYRMELAAAERQLRKLIRQVAEARGRA